MIKCFIQNLPCGYSSKLRINLKSYSLNEDNFSVGQTFSLILTDTSTVTSLITERTYNDILCILSYPKLNDKINYYM